MCAHFFSAATRAYACVRVRICPAVDFAVEFRVSAARDAVVRDSVLAARRDETAEANALARSTACHVGAISLRSICRSALSAPERSGRGAPLRPVRLEIATPSSTADGGLIMELTERLTFDSISNCLAI